MFFLPDYDFIRSKRNSIFKSDECVICLTKEPNILFCNCGHPCLCEECDEKLTVSVINSSSIFCGDVVTCTCPVCKTKNTIKRNIEY